MFLIKNDVNLLNEFGFLKSDVRYLNKKFRNILLELNKEYLDHIKNGKESIIEKILNK